MALSYNAKKYVVQGCCTKKPVEFDYKLFNTWWLVYTISFLTINQKYYDIGNYGRFSFLHGTAIVNRLIYFSFHNNSFSPRWVFGEDSISPLLPLNNLQPIVDLKKECERLLIWLACTITNQIHGFVKLWSKANSANLTFFFFSVFVGRRRSLYTTTVQEDEVCS